jgi:hypothetical protein
MTNKNSSLPGLEEEWGEVDEVVAPREPDVGSWGFDGGGVQAVGAGPGDEVAVGLEELVVGAAGDPEEAQGCG